MMLMPSSDELLSGGPPQTGTATTTKYLGVPEGYEADRPHVEYNRQGIARGLGITTPEFRRTVAPRYTESDVARVSSLPPEQKARLQRALLAAGLFDDEDEFTVGKWDDASMKAYRKILGYANQSGRNVAEALEEWASLTEANGGPGKKGRERAPLVTQVSNPMDLQAMADRGAPDVIGRRVRPDEMQQIASQYQGMEAGAQQAAYNAAATGGQVTAAPDFSSYLQSKLREIDPKGAQKMDTIGLADEFFKLFGSVE